MVFCEEHLNSNGLCECCENELGQPQGELDIDHYDAWRDKQDSKND
jgi:hypothetical protein